MPTSVAQFIEQLRSNDLLPEADLRAVEVDELAADRGRDAEPLAQRLVRDKKLTLFQATQLYRGRGAALVLGNYVVLEKLGQGGMGIVYKARHRVMDRIVAIKVLPSALAKDEQAVRRFQREVRAAAQLAHPNVVTAFDADTAQGSLYLVMEFVDGQDLATLVRQRGRLNVAETVDYLLQAAKGLEYAHAMGVVHRDIKPGNLLLSRDGVVKILDLGLARCSLVPAGGVPVDDELTRSGQMLGTVDYMAPEQSYDTREADQRSDIYSLGCTLYRLLTGQPPYVADSVVKRVMAHRESPVPSLRAQRPEVPHQLDELCGRMMAKRPEDRPQSMRDVVAELKEIAGELGSLAHAAPDGSDLAPLPDFPNDTRLTFADGDVATPRMTEPAAPESWATGATATALPASLGQNDRPAPWWARLGSLFVALPRGARGGRPWVLAGSALGFVVLLAAAWLLFGDSGSPTGSNKNGAALPSDTLPGKRPEGKRSKLEPSPPIAGSRPLRVLFLVPQEGFWIPDYQPVRDRLQQAGIEVGLASSRRGPAGGRNTFEGPDTLRETVQISASEAVDQIEKFDAIYVVGKPTQAGDNEFAAGGAQSEEARRLLRTALERGKIVASVCRGTVVLHGAGILEGRSVAQGRYIPEVTGDTSVRWRRGEAVVRDGPLVTGADPPDAGQLAERLVELLTQRSSSAP
jgi:serine/threonine-protein kinase